MQSKRLHEYKRQLLNIMHVIYLYDRLMHDPGFDMAPATFLFAAKASANYTLAKQIIKLINVVAKKLESAPPRVKERLTVAFVENYNVTSAELLIPAADVSSRSLPPARKRAARAT